jgi:2-oxoisovalerate dehydrogenase E1 component
MQQEDVKIDDKMTFDEFKTRVLADFRLASISRQASLLGRKEVLTGKAKFGIFGDGKEVAQLAMAKAFQDGDFRSGYYRDQTFMFAIGESDVRKFFAQLYSDMDPEREPASAGRQMNGHYATRFLDEKGEWKDLTASKNSSADVSPTASQMPRLLGLAYASKLYRNLPELKEFSKFSNNGNEVAFGTIGNASSAEGLFWESINAGGVLMAPMAVSIWDDGYGISVPNKYQITKQDLSELLEGFRYDEEKEQGYLLYTANGWDYPALVKMYEDGIKQVREKHIPAIFHVKEMTQPQGHSTSGSHERYKSKERLAWEEEYDCIKKMREWMLSSAIATEEELIAIEKEAKDSVKLDQRAAWDSYLEGIKTDRQALSDLFEAMAEVGNFDEKINEVKNNMLQSLDVDRKTMMRSLWEVLRITRGDKSEARQAITDWSKAQDTGNADRYNSMLYSGNALDIEEVLPRYDDSAPLVDGREVLVAYFEKAFARDPRIFTFGEDTGKIGDVNQGMAGMQEKFGELRVSDTGIREATILGQGIGAAMRGLRPIAEIQYLDYLLYALQIMSDDLSTLYYRTKGGQKAPVIVRTRGHRLEGVWHSGSPLGTIVNALRGMYVCVPRNMTQAARFYNTLLQSDEPALVIERLNGYRQKEKMPTNLDEMNLPLGQVEIIEEGSDITVVTYGACIEIAQAAIKKLAEEGISVELIDVQTLLPFDIGHDIVKSLQKTNRILFLDEDVPGGSSAYMMQNVLEGQGGYYYLDSAPRTLTAKAHRPPYGTDGDYFSKPNAEDIFNTVFEIMSEADPDRWQKFW